MGLYNTNYGNMKRDADSVSLALVHGGQQRLAL
jgi:hypothetical protein